MATVLYLESSTTVCSVAITVGGEMLALREINDGYRHAELLTVFIEEVLKEASLKTTDIDYLALSQGPGSYTGLRISASVIKGLAFALGIPVVGVDSLTVIANNVEDNLKKEVEFIIPMIDARRMEVYQCVFDKLLKRVTPISPLILSEQSYLEFLNKGRCLFIGNSNVKAKQIINHPNAFFEDVYSSAKGLINPSKFLIENSNFLDVAYFEPIYLKQFGEK